MYSISNVHFAVDDDDTSDLERVKWESNVFQESPEGGDPPTECPGSIQKYPEICNNGSGVHTYIDEAEDRLDGSWTDGERRRQNFTDVMKQTGEEEPSGRTQLPYESFQIKERKIKEEEYKDTKKVCVFPVLSEGDAKDDENDDPGERIKENRKTSKEELLYEKFTSPSRKTSSDHSRKTSDDRSRRTSGDHFKRASSE